ncbi:MAG: transcriptional regulator with XRE-family HTH domain [Clostridium sp.]|jgi:transcriptional regulator with XRE-family HTH domain
MSYISCIIFTMEVIHLVTFGDRLKTERNRIHVTLETMAEDLKTTKATLSRYENNLREPKVDFVKQIADYLQCSTDYLLGRTDNRLGIIAQDNAYNNDIKIEIDKSIYPDNLTHEQVLEILENLKNAGFKWESKDK